MGDPTALSHWFPRLQRAGLPVPATTLIRMPEEARRAIWATFDGKEDGNPIPFFDEIKRACLEVGLPAFLRTDHTSGKHGWARTCFVADADAIPSHVFAIVEYSEMASLVGISWETWAVREMLPTKPLGTCPYYDGMPLNREFRFFVDGSEVRCWHPYWSMEAIERGGAIVDHDELCRMPDAAELHALASKAGEAVGGAWSIDILETERGWFITDMAEAHKSFHWDGCPFTGGAG